MALALVLQIAIDTEKGTVAVAGPALEKQLECLRLLISAQQAVMDHHAAKPQVSVPTPEERSRLQIVG